MTEQCKHDGCTCTVERADAYCSAHCREAAQKGAGSGRGGCRCGHTGCSSGTR